MASHHMATAVGEDGIRETADCRVAAAAIHMMAALAQSYTLSL